ncbi:MAG: Ig-like domain-containing protein, partial [candidate division WOR-3 bacterium]
MKRFYILILLSLIILCKKKDEEPPRVSIISPLNNESFFPDTIEIKVKAEDNEGIDYIEVFVDGILLGRAQRNFATFKWDGTSAPDSSQHTVYAKAIDFAGNIGRSKDVKFFIYSSNHPPSIKLISPDSGSILASNQVTFIFKGKDKDAFDTLFYSIYLDTIPYPIFKEPVVKDLKDTTYTLSNLLYNKKYYWQVVVRDLLGLKDTSKIFFFLTPPLNQKPLPPSNPYPPDGATD